MRKLWNTVSFIAVVNLVAIVMFGGWLWRSDRLDVDRIRAVRDMIATTISADAAAAAEVEAADEQKEQAASEAALVADPALPSGAQIRQASLREERSAQALRRVQDSAGQRLDELQRRADRLDAREEALLARQAAWEEALALQADEDVESQFQKTVALYEALAGPQAKRMLVELVAVGQVDQAVAYLDAMNRRAAAKTLKSLKTGEENKLATDLLERLRTLGIDTEIAETDSNDQSRSK
jgi:hypothetical protein